MFMISRFVRNLIALRTKKSHESRSRQCRIEQLESKTVLSGAPTIGFFGVAGTEEVVPAFELGEKIQLVATDVFDEDGTLKTVEFWWDADGNQVFDSQNDIFLPIGQSALTQKQFLQGSVFEKPFDTSVGFERASDDFVAPEAGRHMVFAVATDNESNPTIEELSIDLLSVDLQGFDAGGSTSGTGDGLPLFVNTDDDPGTAPGNDSADEIFENGDDDLGRIRITQLPTGLDAGTLTLSTDDAAKIRVFTPITSEVVDLSSPITLDLANPSGVLASAVTGDLDLFVEGIATTGSDPVMVTLKLEHAGVTVEDTLRIDIVERDTIVIAGTATYANSLAKNLDDPMRPIRGAKVEVFLQEVVPDGLTDRETLDAGYTNDNGYYFFNDVVPSSLVGEIDPSIFVYAEAQQTHSDFTHSPFKMYVPDPIFSTLTGLEIIETGNTESLVDTNQVVAIDYAPLPSVPNPNLDEPPPYDANRAFEVFDALTTAHRYYASLLPDDETPEHVDVVFHSSADTQYTGSTFNNIVVNHTDPFSTRRDSWDFVMEEYFHFVQDITGIDTIISNTNHEPSYNLRYRGLIDDLTFGDQFVAWIEGQAAFLSELAQHERGADRFALNGVADLTKLGYSLEAGPKSSGEAFGEDNEASVAKVLWDFYDGGEGDDDTLDGAIADDFWTIFSTGIKPLTLDDFRLKSLASLSLPDDEELIYGHGAIYEAAQVSPFNLKVLDGSPLKLQFDVPRGTDVSGALTDDALFSLVEVVVYNESVASLQRIDGDVLSVFAYSTGPKLTKEGNHGWTGRVCSGCNRRNHSCRRPAQAESRGAQPQLFAPALSEMRAPLLSQTDFRTDAARRGRSGQRTPSEHSSHLLTALLLPM